MPGFAPNLSLARRRVNSSLLSPATVLRGGLALGLTMPDGSPLRCRVGLESQARVLGAPRVEEIPRWRIVFADNTPVRPRDQVRTQHCLYTIMEVQEPTTLSVATTCLAYLAATADANGNPTVPAGFPANCTILTRRGATVVNPALDAMIEPPDSEQIAAWGGELYHAVTVVPPISTVRQGDFLVVLTCTANPALVLAAAAGWPISAVRQRADTIEPATLFQARQPVQP